MSNGFNPLRWDCEQRGCFNVKQRPKIEHFADCFRGKIGMGDIDGCVEISGYFLFFEMKSYQGEIPMGQRRCLEQLTKSPKNFVLVVSGCAETMEIDARQWVIGGKFGDWAESSLALVKIEMKAWADAPWNWGATLAVAA